MDGLKKLELLEGIDDEYVASADNLRRKRPLWKTVLPVAAAFVLIAGAALLIGKSLINPKAPDKDAAAASVNTESPSITEAPTDAPVITEPVTEQAREAWVELQPISSVEWAEGSQDPEWGFNYSMFIYHGKIYRLFGRYDPLADMIGPKVGTVELFWYDPAISDESESDDPPVINLYDYELTGTEGGSIFEVKGFDPEKMLCKRSWNGIEIYRNTDGIESEKGSEFLENVLHLSDRLTGVRYVDPCVIDDDFDDRLMELKRSEYAEAIDGFIAALDEGEWTEDTERSSDVGWWASIALDDGTSFYVHVFTDNRALFGEYGSGYAVKIDSSRTAPLRKLITNHEGTDLGCANMTGFETCRNNERFGAYVPKIIPEGHIINLTYIDYDIDYDSGEIKGTKRMRIDYKSDVQGYTIYTWFMPIEAAETDSDVKHFREMGGKVTALEELTKADILTEGSISHDDLISYAAVTYRDVCIYISAPDTRPETVYELLRSIVG